MASGELSVSDGEKTSFRIFRVLEREDIWSRYLLFLSQWRHKYDARYNHASTFPFDMASMKTICKDGLYKLNVLSDLSNHLGDYASNSSTNLTICEQRGSNPTTNVSDNRNIKIYCRKGFQRWDSSKGSQDYLQRCDWFTDMDASYLSTTQPTVSKKTLTKALCCKQSGCWRLVGEPWSWSPPRPRSRSPRPGTGPPVPRTPTTLPAQIWKH